MGLGNDDGLVLGVASKKPDSMDDILMGCDVKASLLGCELWQEGIFTYFCGCRHKKPKGLKDILVLSATIVCKAT